MNSLLRAMGWLLNRLPPWCLRWAPRALQQAAYRQRLRRLINTP